MTLLEYVKLRLGVIYSVAAKDDEITGMIEEALSLMIGSGWNVKESPDKEVECYSAAGTVVLYCKMAQSTDPADLSIHPVMLASIARGRAANSA